MAKQYACILIDPKRNMVVGRFKNLGQALSYAKEEDIRTVTWEFIKEAKHV